jgi:hypothetical protein
MPGKKIIGTEKIIDGEADVGTGTLGVDREPHATETMIQHP